MSDQLVPTEFEDLNPVEKSRAIVKLYLNGECIGEGTIQEISEKLGRTTNSLYVGLHRTRIGEAKFKKYSVELLKYVPILKKYELYEENTKTNISVLLGSGTIEELACKWGYSESYLRRLSSEKSMESLYATYKTNKRKTHCIYLVEVEEGEDDE